MSYNCLIIPNLHNFFTKLLISYGNHIKLSKHLCWHIGLNIDRIHIFDVAIQPILDMIIKTTLHCHVPRDFLSFFLICQISELWIDIFNCNFTAQYLEVREKQYDKKEYLDFYTVSATRKVVFQRTLFYSALYL